MTRLLLLAGPVGGLAHMLSQPFLRHALVAGTAVAVASGLAGYFLVLRGQVFTGDALGHVAFTGALAALAGGADLLVGLYGSCVAVGLLMAALGSRGRPDDTVIGSLFAWVLGLGALFLAWYTTSAAGRSARTGVSVLFGSIFGLSASQTWTATGVSAAAAVVLVGLGRPLLFASIDGAVAAARRVPVRPLGAAFLVVVGVTAAAASQAVGALLLLGLLAAPAGAAHRLTSSPFAGLWLSAGLATASVWTGLGVSYAFPVVPPSFGILATSTALYLASFLLPAGHRSGRDRPAGRERDVRL